MSEIDFGDVIHPDHCRVSASADQRQIAFTFATKGHKPVSIVLPIAGAIGLQRNLAQTIYILTANPPQEGVKTDAEPIAQSA